MQQKHIGAVMAQFEGLDADSQRMAAKLIQSLYDEQTVKRTNLTLVCNTAPRNVRVFIGCAG